MKVAGTYLGHAATERAAVQLIRGHTGESAVQKVIKVNRSKAYKGVVYHSRNKSFVAQHKCKTIGGCHGTAVAAAETLRKHLKLKSADDLKKEKSELQPAPFRDRLRVLQKLYCKKGKHLLPGDLASSLQQYKTKATSRMFDKEPLFEDLRLMAKYGPIKEHMVKEWKAMGCPGAKEHSMKEREELCYKVVEKTARHFSGDALHEWVANCGRNVSYHSGFVPLLHRLGVVTSKRPRGVSKGMACDLTGIGAACVKYFVGVEEARGKLRKFIMIADAVSAVPVPKTGAEWLESMGNLFRNTKGASGSKKYLKKWHLRSRWFQRQKAHLGKRLSKGTVSGAAIGNPPGGLDSGSSAGRGLVWTPPTHLPSPHSTLRTKCLRQNDVSKAPIGQGFSA